MVLFFLFFIFWQIKKRSIEKRRQKSNSRYKLPIHPPSSSLYDYIANKINLSMIISKPMEEPNRLAPLSHICSKLTSPSSLLHLPNLKNSVSPHLNRQPQGPIYSWTQKWLLALQMLIAHSAVSQLPRLMRISRTITQRLLTASQQQPELPWAHSLPLLHHTIKLSIVSDSSAASQSMAGQCLMSHGRQTIHFLHF